MDQAAGLLSLQGRRWRMRAVLLWALGIPIPVIVLLYIFHVI
ncbi:MAG TPA: hypothetical protein VE397_07830 [Stellaceae bacterium]|nr:hypothetical protein [Stellaceae bacterium]